MSDHWSEFGPPVYIAVAGYLGLIKKPGKPAPLAKSPEKGDLGQLAAMLSKTGGVLNG